jgi:O-antigen ligase
MTQLRRLAPVADLAVVLLLGCAALVLLATAKDRLVLVAVGICALAIAGVLVTRPQATLGLLLAAALVIEQEYLNGAFIEQRRFYEPVFHKLTIPDFLVGATLLGLVATRRRHALVAAGRQTLALVLLMVALAGGLITGASGGASRLTALAEARPLLYLIAIPFLIVNLWPDDSFLRRVVNAFMGIVLLKALEAIAVAVTGAGLSGAKAAGATLVFQNQTPAIIFSSSLLLVLVLLLRGVAFPRWWLLTAAASLITTVISLRRGVWLGDCAAIAAVVGYFAAISGNRRRGAIAGTVLIVLVGAVAISTATSTGSDNPIVSRVRTLTSGSESSGSDRYRIGEQRNIIWNISHAPVTGIGIGTLWDAKYPVPLQFPAARSYSHNMYTYMWLKLGVAGIAAFLLILITALRLSVRLDRRHPDPLVAAACLAAGATLICFMVSGMGNSELGVTVRGSLFGAMLLGFLAAAERTAAQRSA